MKRIIYIITALLGVVSALSCTKDIDETQYDTVLEQYDGDYYISSFEWLGGSGLPSTVSIIEGGEAGTNLLAQICSFFPEYKLRWSRLSVSYGARHCAVYLNVPLLNYTIDEFNNNALTVEIYQPTLYLSVSVDLDKDLVWEGFNSLTSPANEAERVLKDGSVTEYSTDSFTFEFLHYLIYDYASNAWCDGAVRLTFQKKTD